MVVDGWNDRSLLGFWNSLDHPANRGRTCICTDGGRSDSHWADLFAFRASGFAGRACFMDEGIGGDSSGRRGKHYNIFKIV